MPRTISFHASLMSALFPLDERRRLALARLQSDLTKSFD
jgi:hypothetical protein